MNKKELLLKRRAELIDMKTDMKNKRKLLQKFKKEMDSINRLLLTIEDQEYLDWIIMINNLRKNNEP